MFNLLGVRDINWNKKLEAARNKIMHLRELIKEEINKVPKDVLKQTAYKMESEGKFDSDHYLNVVGRFASLRQQRILRGHSVRIYSLYWAFNGKDILSASGDGTLMIWNAGCAKPKLAIPLNNKFVMTCCYAPNNECIASGGLDNIVSVYNMNHEYGYKPCLADKQLLYHQGYISCARFTDNHHILS